MTDKIPSFKEQVDKIQVPVDKLDQIIVQTVGKHAPMRKSFKRKFVYSLGTAIVAFGLLISSATVSPTMANIVSKLPLIGSVFTDSRDAGLANVSALGFTQIIGESKQVGDKVLTIEEAFYDGVRLTISYSLTSETPIDANYFSFGPGFKIDGYRYETNTSRAENEITSTFHTGLLEVEITKKLPDQFKLDLVFSGRDNSRWTFSIPIQSTTSADILKINHQQQAAGVNLTVTEMSNSLGGLKVNFETISENEIPWPVYINFLVEDDLGNEIPSLSGGRFAGEGTNKKFYGSDVFNPIDDQVKEITITPYFYIQDSRDISKEVKEKLKAFEKAKFDSFTVKLSK